MPIYPSGQINRRRKVLVLGDDYRMTLPITRSLGRSGIDVHLAWCAPDSPTCRSRYAGKWHELPWYSAEDYRWTKSLNALVEKESFRLVIPATEHAVYALQTNRDRLSREEQFYLLDDKAFRTVFDKQATYAICQQEGIPYPKTIPVRCLKQLDEAWHQLGERVIVKPSCSVTTEQEFDKAFVRRCQTREEARAYVSFLLDNGSELALQQHAAGEGVGVELLAREGSILTALQHRRIHETTGHGSTYRVTVPLKQQLVNACRKMIAALNYTGVAMVEFRVDPKTNAWSLIEVNGRFWGSLPLAAAAGIDFPLHLFQMLAEGRRTFPQSYRTGVRSRALTNDLRWLCRWATRRGTTFDAEDTEELGWVANEVPWPRVLHGVARGLTLRDHIDSFAYDDMRPALAELDGLCSDAVHSIRRRLPRPPREAFIQRLLWNPHFAN